MSVGSTQEGENVLAEEFADCGGKTGTDERELELFPKCVLDHGEELHQVVDGFALEFIDGDEQPSLVRREHFAKVCDL